MLILFSPFRQELLSQTVYVICKGASAFAINHMQGSDGQFKWQAGYGVLTISDSLLETVARYAAGQKEHHNKKTILDVYEKIDQEE